MSRLVVVVPLKRDARDEARKLLEQGPPLDLEATRYIRHEVYLTHDEVVFVFDAPGEQAPTLSVRAADVRFWRAAAAWQKLMAGPPRTAETVFVWARGGDAAS